MRNLEHRGCLKLSLSWSHKPKTLETKHTHTHTHEHNTTLGEKHWNRRLRRFYILYTALKNSKKSSVNAPKKKGKKKELQTPKRMDFRLRSSTRKKPWDLHPRTKTLKKAEPSTVFCSHNKRFASNWSCLLLQPKFLHEILNKLYSVKSTKLTVHGKRPPQKKKNKNNKPKFYQKLETGREREREIET